MIKFSFKNQSFYDMDLSYLNLPINSSQQAINNALILALQYKDEQIAQLTERIEILENI